MLTFIRAKVDNWSLRNKILAIIISINLILTLIGSMIGLNHVLSQYETMLSNALGNSLSYASSTILSTLDDAESLSNLIIANPTVQDQLSILRRTNDSLTIMSAYRELMSTIQSYYWEYRSQVCLSDIRIDSQLFSSPIQVGLSKVRNEVLSQALDRDGALTIISDYAPENELLLTRSIREVLHFSLYPLGVLTLHIDLEKLVKEATDFSSSYDETYFIIRDGDRVIYQPAGMNAELLKTVDSSLPESHGRIKLHDHWYFSVRGTMDKYGWDYLCMVSYDDIMHKITLSIATFLLFMFFAMTLSTVLSFMLVNAIIRHFTVLIDKMKTFSLTQQKPAIAQTTYEKRQDEIGQLHRQFDAMADNITTLIQENYVQELLAKDAQLRALETQINPHFLYNVLDSIHWRAHTIGAIKIAEMVEALASLLRVALDRSKKVHTLREELDLVDGYVTIQQFRYEDRMQFVKMVDDSLLSAVVPKMVIQPLVENAVRHGVEASLEDHNLITLSMEKSGDLLLIRVSNTGSQFEDDLLQKLRTNTIQPGGFGIGLLNIDKRIQLMFGEEYGLMLNNEENLAVACIRMPLHHT